MRKPQMLIGATSSGSGKTTFTIGLLRALKNRGYQLQPFKCGPDYLDTKHHTKAARKESINLDLFMSSGNYVRSLYHKYGQNADICITEGVMGLFDGYSGMEGSSAMLAEELGIPVILVVNARSTAYSVAPLLYGFKNFYKNIEIAGVIFNFVASETHYSFLKQAAENAGIESLGYLPKDSDIEIPSRHLGLNIDTDFCFDNFADRIAVLLEKSVNIDRLLSICNRTFLTDATTEIKEQPEFSKLRISVARDEAFNFIYPENLEILRKLGEVTFFSPLSDYSLPSSDLVYLPGGYPEFYLPQLAANENMKQSVREYCENGGHLLAECGGMMYLGKQIYDEKGGSFTMAGVLPQNATMENMCLRLGYRKVIIEGREYRGHEFHYSRILPIPETEESHSTMPTTIGQVYNAKDGKVDTPIYRYKNVTASYIHFLFTNREQVYTFIFSSIRTKSEETGTGIQGGNQQNGK